jgi:hypothetical protein
MDKRIKIVLIVIIFFGVISGIFLLFAKKKPAVVPAPKTVQSSAQVKSLTPASNQQKSARIPKASPSTQAGLPKTEPSTQVNPQDRKLIVAKQWKDCKEKTITANTNLLWSVQITEGIPAKGTYAKGNLNNDTVMPVHVIIKSDSTIIEKIKAMLVVGKTAFLRGTCTEVATDGSVVLQAF